MTNLNFKKVFWDKKILGWEKEKYHINNLILDPNSSLKYRMILAKNILSKVAKNKTVLEVGCGSGLLLTDLEQMGVKKYIGVDISSEAIKKAKINAKHLKKMEVKFINSDLGNISGYNVDVCFSLGLLDWVSLPEIKRIKENISTKFYFHTFSEKRFSITQLAHTIFVYAKYGYKTKGYKPNYYKSADIQNCFQTRGTKISFFRRSELSFGTLVYDLPFDITKDFLINDK